MLAIVSIAINEFCWVTIFRLGAYNIDLINKKGTTNGDLTRNPKHITLNPNPMPRGTLVDPSSNRLKGSLKGTLYTMMVTIGSLLFPMDSQAFRVSSNSFAGVSG